MTPAPCGEVDELLEPVRSWPERTTLPPVSEGMPGSRACPPQIDEPWCGTRQHTMQPKLSIKRARVHSQRTHDQHQHLDTTPPLQECRSALAISRQSGQSVRPTAMRRGSGSTVRC